MCTLTAIQIADKIVVTMNRDESRDRDEAGILENIQSIHGPRAVFPIDLQSNGSWFGANNCGVVLGILNRYQNPLKTNPISRGKIIPKALSLGGVEEILDFCGNLKVKNYNPFDLILVSTKHCYQFNWDSSDYHITPFDLEQDYIISSSSVDMEEVLAHRKKIFSEWTSQTGTKNEHTVLRQFHLHQQKNRSHSVFMAREHSHTKSVCQAVISRSSCHLHYLPLPELEKFTNAAISKQTKQTVILPFKTCSKKNTV